MKQILSSIFLCVICCFNLPSQSYHTLFSGGHNYFSDNNLPGQNKISQFYLRASLPLKLKSGDYLLFNPDLHQQTIVFSDSLSKFCYKTGLTLAFMKIRPNGSIIGFVNLNNNFSMGYSGKASLQTGGGFLVTRKMNPNFKLKYGLYVNREFFGPIVAPLLGMDYKINERLRVFGILPQSMKLEYKFRPSIRSGILFETPINTYRISRQNYIEQRQVLLGLVQEFYIGKNLVFIMGMKYPLSNKQKIFRTEQRYDATLWGLGFGGYRTKDNEAMVSMKHLFLFDFSLNYRIETE